jgi:hypothetical protein
MLCAPSRGQLSFPVFILSGCFFLRNGICQIWSQKMEIASFFAAIRSDPAYQLVSRTEPVS